MSTRFDRAASPAAQGSDELPQALPPIALSGLLCALFGEDATRAASVLHPEVALTRADGAVVRGAHEVIEGVRAGRYEVLAVEADTITVRLSLPELAASLRFAVRGAAASGRLISIEVTLLGLMGER